MDIMKRIKEQHPDVLVLFLTRFGSHLYGTNTPDSDTDYKGVFMPTARDVCLGTIPKSLRLDSNTTNEKNTSKDVDCELYSLHHFISLACKGETVALDMLHASSNLSAVVVETGIWDAIEKQRQAFYTKNLKAFVGYARKQAAKYGIKGSRLASAKEFSDFLSKLPDDDRLTKHWAKLPNLEHSKKEPHCDPFIATYEICGKKVQNTVTVRYAKGVIDKFITQFGHRAEQALSNEGIDWKAISHALRAGYQVRELYLRSTITFPIAQKDYLLDVKLGKLDYKTEVAPVLEDLMEELDEMSKNTKFPDKVNHGYWQDWLFKTTRSMIRWEI